MLARQIIVLVHQQQQQRQRNHALVVTNPFVIINPSSGIIERQTEPAGAAAAREGEWKEKRWRKTLE